jgi:hypothetical protein
MRKFAILVCAATICLAGCAPLQVDLSRSEYRPVVTTAPKQVRSVTVIDRAPTPEVQNKLFGTSEIPIKTTVPLRATVESDVKLLFAQAVQTNSNSNTAVLVTLRQADAYWAMGVADKIPFVGLATAARDRDFTMHVVMSIEVRKNGAVTSTYPVDRTVTIVGKATTRDDVASSYQRLIAKYREVVLGDIEHNFIDMTL